MPLVPHLERFIDNSYAGCTFPGVTVPIPTAIKARLEHLAANPHEYKQLHGCCGFAAVIMALIRHNRYKFQALCAACYNDEATGNVTLLAWPGRLVEVRDMATKVGRPLSLRTRLEWREDAMRFYRDPAAPVPAAPVWEVRVSVGLMILFKEWLRRQPAPTDAIWAECTQFSTLFGDYRQNSKVGRVKDHDIDLGQFSRKRGDLALTPSAVRQLARFVFEHISYTGDLANTLVDAPSRTAFTPTLGSTFLVGEPDVVATFAEAGNYLEAQARQPIVATSFDGLHRSAVQRLLALQRDRAAILGTRFLGIILGLANISEIQSSEHGMGRPRQMAPTVPTGATTTRTTAYADDMRAYGMIVHWVFVPPEQNYAADGLVVWSWGERHRLFEPPPVAVAAPVLKIFPTNFLPVWAMPIEQPSP